MASGDITHDETVGTLLTGTLATLYTVPAGKVLLSLEILNSHVSGTAVQYPEAQLIPSGQAAGTRYRLFMYQSAGGNGFQPGEPRPFSCNPMAAAGAFVQMRNTDGAAGAGTTDVTNAHISAVLKEL